MYARTYTSITPVFWVFRDAEEDARLERLRFHIQNGDYFPFLATVLSFAKEALIDRAHTAPETVEQQISFISETQKDLIHLHENYQITPKEAPISFTKEKVLHWKP